MMNWWVIFLYAIWSSVFAFGKWMLVFSTPLFLTSARMILGGVFMLSYLWIWKRTQFRFERKDWISISALALFSIFLTNFLEFWGLQYLSSAKTCFIYSLSPFLAALFSYIHFKEKMNRAKWIGMGIGILGMIPVFMIQTGSEELLKAFSFFTWPTLAIIGAALFSVYGWVILRLIVKEKEVSPIMANGTSMLLGGFFSLISSLFIDPWDPIPVHAGKISPFFFGTLGMTLLYNLLCYNLYGFLLRYYTATFLSFVGLLSPIFASFTAWIFLGEPLSWQIFVSSLIVSLGLWIVYKSELKQGYIKRRSLSKQTEPF